MNNDQHAELAAACESVGIEVHPMLYDALSRGGDKLYRAAFRPIPDLLKTLEGWAKDQPTYVQSSLGHRIHRNAPSRWCMTWNIASATVIKYGPDKQAARVAAAIATVKILEGQR